MPIRVEKTLTRSAQTSEPVGSKERKLNVSMRMRDFLLLKKLMAMTTSDADAEVLMAIRQANLMLSKEGLTWETVFSRTVTVVNEFEAAPDQIDEPATKAGSSVRIDPEAERIDAAFAAIDDAGTRGSFGDFIESLRDQWEKRRSLSDKQRAALFKAAYERR